MNISRELKTQSLARMCGLLRKMIAGSCSTAWSLSVVSAYGQTAIACCTRPSTIAVLLPFTSVRHLCFRLAWVTDLGPWP